MQFREKGLKVLCIRSRYVPEKKRTVGDTVASQHISLSTVTNEVRQQLSNEEVDELQAWLSNRHAAELAERNNRNLRILHLFLNDAADALDDSAVLEEENWLSSVLCGTLACNHSL